MRGIHATYMAELGKHLGRQDAADQNARAAAAVERLAAVVQAGLADRVRKAFDPMAKKVAANAWQLTGVTLRDTGVEKAVLRARNENIQLVEKAARAYAADVRAIMEDPDTFGQRVEVIRDRLIERGNVSESRAELIARDQTLKLNGAITQERQKEAGVSRYTWSTSKDERVRETHADKEGEVFEWSNPPEDTGHPGEDYQCRCVAIAILPWEDEG